MDTEGIEDILPEQAYWLELKRREVIETSSYGYGLVIPPLMSITIHYIKCKEDLDLQTFKLIDQDWPQLAWADITSQYQEYIHIVARGD